MVNKCFKCFLLGILSTQFALSHFTRWSFSDHTLLGSCVTSWAGKHQMTSTQGKAAPIVSHQRGFYTDPSWWNFVPAFRPFWRHIVLFPVNHTCLSSQCWVMSCMPSSKSLVAGDKTVRLRSLCTAPRRPAGGKCLNLKFTTQVTGSLQLSSNDAAIRVTMSTCTPSPSFHLHVWLLTR